MIYSGPYVITSYDPVVGTTLEKNEKILGCGECGG
jgi:ABC-type oligopeptide transport system substrate-binding subunit